MVKKSVNKAGSKGKKKVSPNSPSKRGSDTVSAAPKKRYAKGLFAKKVCGAAKQTSCTSCGPESMTCPFCTWPGMLLLVIAIVLVAWGHPYAKYLAWIFLLAAILSPWLMKLISRHHG